MSWKDIIKAPIRRDEAQKINRESIRPLIEQIDEIIKGRLASGETTAWISTAQGNIEVSGKGGNETLNTRHYNRDGYPIDRDIVMNILYRVWKEESDADVRFDGVTIRIKFSEDIEYKDKE